jgi:esterase/lipase superfamily enzyme
LLVGLAALALGPAVSVQAQESRRESVTTPAIRDNRTTAPRVARGETAMARARAAMEAQDFATAHKEYRAAADSTRGVAGMEKVFADAIRGFAESGVKLAQQRKGQGRIPEAERILREILSPRYNPKYAPALELLATLRPSAVPTVRGFTTTPPTTRSAPPPEAIPEEQPEFVEEKATPPPRRTPTYTTAAPPERSSDPAATTPVTAAVKKPLVKVYFGTDRLPSGTRGVSKYFSGEANPAEDALVTGVVTVSIPPVHKEGQVERPGTFLFLWERKEDLKKHFVLTELRVAERDEFYEELRGDVLQRSAEDRSALVYIHGFNTTFDQAAYSTAQIAYDLDFKGVPVMFSWPSQGKLLGYHGDEETVELSSPHLQLFLERIARESNASRIHIVAHSLGNRLLTKTMGELVRQADIQPLFDNVIMAAPDVNARSFQQLWPQIKVAAKRFTLYASSQDNALIASRESRGGRNFARLGEGGPNIVVIPGLDTIDASGIDTSLLGHAYVDSCKPVMRDLGLLIGKGFDPEKRKLRQNREGLGFWSFP